MRKFNCTSFPKHFQDILRTGNFPVKVKLADIITLFKENNHLGKKTIGLLVFYP